MKRLIYIFILVMTSNFMLAAVKGTVTGVVLDAGNQESLPGAHVVWVKEQKVVMATLTDEKGNFILENIEDGMQHIKVQFIGYAAIDTVVNIDHSETIPFKFKLNRTSLDLSPVNIIGHPPNSIQNLPGTGTRMEKEEIDLIKPIGTQELLEQVPGINAFADDGMGNSRLNIGIRGLNPRRSSRALILEDGIPLQPAIYLYPNTYYNPPVERIDEVEIIKGSSAIQYGPQTMGGVINYITRRPRRDPGGMVVVSGGNNAYSSVFVESGGWGNENYHPELQLLYKRGDGFRENNGFEQTNATFKMRVLPDSRSHLYIKGNFNFENSNATYTGLTEHSFRVNPRFNPKEHDNFRVLRGALDVTYHKQHHDNLTSTTKVYINVFDRNWWRESDIFVDAATYKPEADNTPVPWYTSGNIIRVGNNRSNFGILRRFYVAGAERSYDYEYQLFGKKSNLETGARIHWERFIDDKQIGFSPDATEGKYFVVKGVDQEWNQWNSWDPIRNIDSIGVLGQSHHYETNAFSGFIQNKFHVSEKLVIIPGVRLEWFEQARIDRMRGNRYDDKITAVILPGAGLNYTLGDVSIFGGVHRGFTPPSSGTLKVLDFGGSTTEALDLKAEKSWNKEIGVRGNFRTLAFEVAGFHLTVEDLVAAGRGTAFKNLGVVQTRGLESALKLSLGRMFENKLNYLPDINVAYTWLQTEIVSGRIQSAFESVDIDIAGNELPYAPRHTLSAGLSKEFTNGLSLRGDLKYVSEVFTDFENTRKVGNRGDMGPIPAYYLIDISGKFRFSEKWTAFAAVKNLLDEVYIGSRLHSNPGQPEAHLSSGILPGGRRQINAGVQYRFGKK